MKTLMIAPLTLLALLLAPLSAQAAEVSVASHDGPVPRGPQIAYSHVVLLAGPGERNDVELRVLDAHRMELRDRGAPLTPRDGCTQRADGWVGCVATVRSVATDAEISLGDGDDRLHVHGDTGVAAVRADGGEGDDAMTASGSTGVRFRGGPGRDELRGGDGTLDVVSYGGSSTPVVVDLAAPRAGVDGTEDAIGGFEGAVGGDGGDVLRGTAGPNMLDGGVVGRDGSSDPALGGADTIVGLGGDDTILARGRGTTIDAGDGDDTIEGRPGQFARPVVCGRGHDRIVSTPSAAEVAFPGRDCERIDGGAFSLTRLKAAGRTLTFTAQGAYPAGSRLCGLRAVLRTADGSRALARVGAKIPNRARGTVRLTARRALPARVAVELRAQECDRRGRMHRATSELDPDEAALRFPFRVR